MATSEPGDVKSDASSNDPEAQQQSSPPSAEKEEKHDEEEAPATPFTPVREVLFVFAICMSQFLSLAGLAQSIAPLPIIGRSFGATDEDLLSWYPAAFSL